MSIATKERPIIFSGPMVRAILDGCKTQTRRIVKVRGLDFMGAGGDKGEDWNDPLCWGWEDQNNPCHFAVLSREPEDGDWSIRCPYGSPGDRLWVRETWALLLCDEDSLDDWGALIPDEHPQLGWQVQYRAGHPWENDSIDDRGFRWRSPRFMPRWASRITLEVVNVRVERLQSISYSDCLAEGIPPVPVYDDGADPETILAAIRGVYREAWESINGKDSWDANPWVWVIEFRRQP